MWEVIVKALKPREHFKNEPYFFLFRGIRTIDEGVTSIEERAFVNPDSRGIYELAVGKQYELLIYHYLPADPVTTIRSVLTISASNPVIEFTSGVSFQLDSGYDQKAARFTVGDTPSTTRGVFTIAGKKWQQIDNEEQESEVTWFDMPVEVPRLWWWLGMKGGLLGAPVALGPIAAVLASKTIDTSDRGWIIALSLIGACLGGALTALFGSRK